MNDLIPIDDETANLSLHLKMLLEPLIARDPNIANAVDLLLIVAKMRVDPSFRQQVLDSLAERNKDLANDLEKKTSTNTDHVFRK